VSDPANAPMLTLEARFADDLPGALQNNTVRADLERQLPGYLQAQRWFGGKARRQLWVQIERWLPLGGACCCVVVANDNTGASSRHPLFLRVQPLAEMRVPLVDALESADFRTFLLQILVQGGSTSHGDLTLACAPLTMSPFAPAEEPTSRLVGVEQSNTSVIYGHQTILKIYRRLETGVSPEVELGRFLTIKAGFAGAPRLLATGRLTGANDFGADLLVLQEFVPNDGDGWAWAVRRASAALDAARDPAALDRWLRDEGETLAAAAELGRTTAQLHAALASATSADLRPAPVTPDDIAAWAAQLRAEAELTAQALHQTSVADAALTQAIAAISQFSPAAIADGGLKTRVHGDYHLGQVLRSTRGFVILDFEGEPARSLADRRRRQHPLVDVAGMVRSWSYAAGAALRASTATPGRRSVAARWEAATRERFLAAYWAEANAAPLPFLPRDEASRVALLQLFELVKALYEVRYEVNNRPTWLDIPASAIKNAERGTRNAE
jgi:trehalose synthase-fused probable maltokinase